MVVMKREGSCSCDCCCGAEGVVQVGLGMGEKQGGRVGWTPAEEVEDEDAEGVGSGKCVTDMVPSEATDSRSWIESRSCMVSSGEVTLVGGDGSQRNWTKSCSVAGLERLLASESISMSPRRLSGRPRTEEERRMSGFKSSWSASGEL